MRSLTIAATLLALSAGTVHASGLYRFHYGGFTYYGPHVVEGAYYHLGPGTYRESPDEAAQRLREAEQRCDAILYADPAKAARQARRCGGR